MAERWDVNDFGWRIEWNEIYNQKWINKYNLNESVKTLECLKKEGLSTNDSEMHEVGWLRNIDRLIDIMPLELNTSDYDLIDAGCGSGISTLYFAENYKFSSYTGFDFSQGLVETARKNLESFNQATDQKVFINFHHCNARNWIHKGHKPFIYMFNPFGYATAKSLINNNLCHFRSTNAVIALAWDTWIGQLAAEFSNIKIIRNNIYKLSLIYFQ